MKKLFQFLMIALSIVMVPALSACSSGSDDEPKGGGDEPAAPSQSELLVGEWMEEVGQTASNKVLFVIKYEKGSSFNVVFDYVTTTDSYFTGWNGTYSIKNSTIILDYVNMLGTKDHSELQIKSIDNYKLTTYDMNMQATEYFYRIVDTYQMNIGETRDLIISDASFSPSSYESSNVRVATVSGGKVQALARGTSYITVNSSVGKAVVRVVVTDPNNYADDLLPYLGENISIAKNDWGAEINDESDDVGSDLTLNLYRVFDDLTQLIGFYYDSTRTIQQINVIYRQGTDSNKIKSWLDKKYEYLGFESDCYYYSTYKNNRVVVIQFLPKYLTLGYSFYESSK